MCSKNLIRSGDLNDLESLVQLETRCFDSDRLSRRTFRYMLTKAHAVLLVDERQGLLAGYALLLFSRGTSMARLYSLATEISFRGQGVAKGLLDEVEHQSLEHGCVSLRIEVRTDNESALKIYRARGFRQFAHVPHYYEDDADALRFEKRLMPQLTREVALVPFYPQSLEFTCGPAALMMAMHALKPEFEMSRTEELRLWRESTTIFMTSGHGGCSPYGLALAAARRGFKAEVYVQKKEPLLLDSVRSGQKRLVMELVQQDFLNQLAQKKMQIHAHKKPSVSYMIRKMKAKAMPLVLISSYRIYQEKSPHWVLLTGADERFIYAHDPFVDTEEGETLSDCLNMPITHKEFEKMTIYGKSRQWAAVLVYNHPAPS